MYLAVEDLDVRLVDANDFSTFYLSAAGISEADLDRRLRRCGAGIAHSGHAFIDPAWLELHGDTNPEWSAALEGMLAFAQSKGWIVDGLVRAHVEAPKPETAPPTNGPGD